MSAPFHEGRGGVRGGRDQFSWEDVRLVSYKDREMYLGHTSKLGFLDKGGKWRKRDWYAHESEKDEENAMSLKKTQEEDEYRMNVALGIIKEVKKDINPNFSKDELLELNKKIANKDFGREKAQDESDSEYEDKTTNLKGLGHHTSLSNELVQNREAYMRLGGEGIIEQSKKIKKDKKDKKSKKDKKDKKDKKEKKVKKEKKHKY